MAYWLLESKIHYTFDVSIFIISYLYRFHKHGSLKDMLCMSTPKNPFLSKYGNPKGRTALSMKQVATYGKQILETLIFLHSKGYAFGECKV